jgi:hypothetical protein
VISLVKAFVYCLLASTTLARLVRRALCATILLALVLGVTAAPNASAGVFQVANCDDDKLTRSVSAFTHFATRRMMIKKACGLVGKEPRGLIVANVVHDGLIKRGSLARVEFTAPPGTRITKFLWAGGPRRRDCRYAMLLFAEAPGLGYKPLYNLKANRRCASAGRAQAAKVKDTFNFPWPGVTRIVQQVMCKGTRERPWCSGRQLNYLRTKSATFDVVDDIAPTVEILQDTPLATGAWVRGTQPLNYTASDNIGVQLARAYFGGLEKAAHTRDCLLASPKGPFSAPLPCPNGPGQIQVSTLEHVEGTQQLVVQAQDAASNTAFSAPVTARIDNTPPTRVDVAVEGGEAWRNRSEWALAWTSPPEGDRAPISAVTYELCTLAGNSCSRGTLASAGISRLPMTVPSAGEWKVKLWRRDAAGNEAEDNASVPVTLRYDPEPPQLAFEPPQSADPTLVAVRVTDQVSGLANGAIEIGAAGSSTWQTLPAQKEGSRLVTRIDDAALPAGTYVLRAHASDQAGNVATTDRLGGGQPMVVTLPLRTPVALRAGFERTIRRRKQRPTTVLRAAARVGFMEQTRIVGRLATRDGRPIGGGAVEVLSRTGTDAEQLVDTLTTDADGRFRSVATGTNSRTLRLAYAGSSLTLPSETSLEMKVPAATSVRVSRRRLRNGQAVTFTGRVRGLPVPIPGKLIELQVRFSSGWQTFRTIRSSTTGRWSSRYRFQRTQGVQHYHFRVRLPKEGGYPFETSVSRALVVQVSGR